jgi:hypothetical protein
MEQQEQLILEEVDLEDSGAPCNSGAAGGSGIVIVRYPAPVAGAVSLAPGTNVKTTAPNGDGIATFTVSGTLTVASSAINIL